MDPVTFWEIALPPIVSIVATAFVGLMVQAIVALAKYYIPMVKAKLGESEFALARETALMVVRALEQSPAYQTWDGAAKKQKAINQLANWFESRGLPVSADLIDALIESAVQQIKGEVAPLLIVDEVVPE
jgi:hypothetical protein